MLTVESLLKGKNKSKTNPAMQEHMSHQYRVWQEKLVSTLKIASTSSQGQYVLLHSAKLVGLFTCIFVRESEKANIGNLSATQVWTGLGGLHGNKVRPPLPPTTIVSNSIGCSSCSFHNR
jgi:hypothetical protein